MALTPQPLNLGALTTLGTGGTATTVFRPESQADFEAITDRTDGSSLAVFARGSNLLVSDGLIETPVLLVSGLSSEVVIDRDGGTLTAGANARMPKIARLAATAGLSGLEFLGGIPGTLGGGVAMNAGTGGTSGQSIAEVLVWFEAFDFESGRVVRIGPDRGRFGYRSSVVQASRLLVMRACLRAEEMVDPRRCLDELRTLLVDRRRRQPLGTRNAGSVFLPTEDGQPAGRLIEDAGLKGYVLGRAAVSTKHANWIEVLPGCTSHEVDALIEYSRLVVKERYGVELELELRHFPAEATQV